MLVVLSGHVLRAIWKVTLASTQSDPKPLRTSAVLFSKHLNNTMGYFIT